jgi:hypothetical protein
MESQEREQDMAAEAVVGDYAMVQGAFMRPAGVDALAGFGA